MSRQLQTGSQTYFNASGKQVVTSGPLSLIGITFCGTATGQIQLFAGTTCSASLTPMITFSATASAAYQGLTPFFLPMPVDVSGNGLTVDLGTTNDPNIIIYWVPQPKTP